jgi:hypothetical protein
VGWGFWLFYNDEGQANNQKDNENEDEQEQQQKGPMPGRWWRGMIWWFSAKEAAYKVRRGMLLAQQRSRQRRALLCWQCGAGQLVLRPCLTPDVVLLGSHRIGKSAVCLVCIAPSTCL